MESRYPTLAVVNFTILAFSGVLLRYMQLYALPGLNYQYLLHAHSHFAFAGWIFLSVSILVTHAFADSNSKAYRTVFFFVMVSAFGMILTFSLQGYRLASIVFSTLFILVTYRFTYLILRRSNLSSAGFFSTKLIKAGLFYLCLSSLGPLALAPVLIFGFGDTPLYQNAIYFYLHFQMNGFMLLTSLGLLASAYPARIPENNAKVWLMVFIYSAIPLFLIFLLWTRPASWVWAAALLASVINLYSWIRLCLYFKENAKKAPFLVKASLLAMTFKMVIQVLICMPAVGEWAFLNRDLIIGYVHLLTLGCVMPLILDQFIRRGFLSGKHLLKINWLYISAVIVYLTLLFIHPLISLFLIAIPNYRLLLFLLSGIFLITGVLYLLKSQHRISVENDVLTK